MHEPVDPAVALVAAVALAAVHVFGRRMLFLGGVPRSRWLSGAAGVSVAYVFVHLLPELAAAQDAVAQTADGVLPFVEEHVYLVALAGLALFYGVEHLSLSSRARRRAGEGEDRTSDAAFWLSTASFGLYNGLIGYLLVRGETETLRELVLFTVALGVHFVINDFGLREHHKEAYARVARWLLAAAVLIGWALGEATEISEGALGLVLAFIAGGIVLNVLKEELPGERQARFLPFLLGAVAYAALLQTF